LVVRAIGGDRDAFGALANQALPRLMGAAGLILGGRETAEDAVQESLVRAWRDLPTLRDPDRFQAWLYRVLNRACVDEARRTARLAKGDATTWGTGVVGDHAAGIAERETVAAALRRVRSEYRTALVLRYYVDLTYEQMAVALNVPVGTAKSRVNRGLREVRAALAAVERSGAVEGELA
jgi:RNA polymerase sigma-70 factor (ECF subfamily)